MNTESLSNNMMGSPNMVSTRTIRANNDQGPTSEKCEAKSPVCDGDEADVNENDSFSVDGKMQSMKRSPLSQGFKTVDWGSGQLADKIQAPQMDFNKLVAEQPEGKNDQLPEIMIAASTRNGC